MKVPYSGTFLFYIAVRKTCAACCAMQKTSRRVAFFLYQTNIHLTKCHGKFL